MVSQLINKNGNAVKNQFVINKNGMIIFQSYESIIAVKKENDIFLNDEKFNYSNTTKRSLLSFLDIENNDFKNNLKNNKYKIISENDIKSMVK